ncbi:hypothetical protein Pelo_10643 [Pelomyxa schiedti]|nr:hypothetical protein Pelo_10643 [Pelomyxa schiedti]
MPRQETRPQARQDPPRGVLDPVPMLPGVGRHLGCHVMHPRPAAAAAAPRPLLPLAPARSRLPELLGHGLPALRPHARILAPAQGGGEPQGRLGPGAAARRGAGARGDDSGDAAEGEVGRGGAEELEGLQEAEGEERPERIYLQGPLECTEGDCEVTSVYLDIDGCWLAHLGILDDVGVCLRVIAWRYLSHYHLQCFTL